MDGPIIKGGYILISRKLVESNIWKKPPLYLKVWMYLLTRAQHTDYEKMVRGQLFTSTEEIRQACSHWVGYRKETPSKSKVYRVIKWLRNPDEEHTNTDTDSVMIQTTKATHGMLVTINNYDYYQDPGNYAANDEAEKKDEAV